MGACEMCGSEAEMDFNCLLLTFEKVLSADLCLACWGGGGDDLELAVEIMKLRAKQRGVSLPTDEAGLVGLFSR